MDYLPEIKEELKKYKVHRLFKENIEPEEILLDAQKTPEFHDQKIEIPLKDRIFTVFFWAILAGLLILITQTAYFQIFKNREYQALAQRNSLRIYPVLAPRGLIYDRNLKLMVNNLSVSNVFITPQDLPKNKFERDTIIEQICDLLELNPKDINQMLLEFDFKREQRILLAGNLAPEKILALESKKSNFPALSIEKGIIRQYLFDQTLSHILGYTGKMTQKDLELYPDYFLTERLGKSGLEAEYEKVLRGKAGERQVEVDTKGQQKKETGMKKEIPGENLVTSIDIDLQQKIFEVLSGKLKALKLTKAVAVALDPNNGDVLALVSLPSFDNNLFEKNSRPEELEQTLNDPDQPLFNRAISGQYASGSVIKPMIGAAALQEGVVTPSTIINDSSGRITVVNQYNPGIVYDFLDWKTHGPVNIYSAIAQSCDVYFYTVGGGYGKIGGLGVDRIKKYLELFGFNHPLGIDLPEEKSGLIPDAAWKEKAKSEPWYIGDTYHISIGQGDLLVTPLQMASAIAYVANGGSLFVPRVVDKIVDSDKNNITVFNPRIIREKFIKAENLAAVKKGMREAVVSGSAGLLSDLPVKVAGKTGTAQVAGQNQPNAWFVSFAPYDDPKIVLVILIENGGEGSAVAVPLAKEIYNWYFNK